MKEFISKYGGWILATIFGMILIYLIFRPVPTFDNGAAIKVIDSLSKDNAALRIALRETEKVKGKAIDSLTKASDSLGDRGIVLQDKLEAAVDKAYSLAKQYEYYKLHNDKVSSDSACNLLAKQVILDSGTIAGYISNTNRLVFTFNEAIAQRDSVNLQQKDLILSDSVLISKQGNLITTQEAQLKKVTKTGKVFAWIGRALFVIAVSEGVALAIK